MAVPSMHVLAGKQPASGGGFAPTGVAGCLLWLGAADAATFTCSSGTLVSQWSDKSGNSNHATQGNAADQPDRAGSQNGLATVSWPSNDMLNLPNQAASEDQTFFFVMKDTGGDWTSGSFFCWGRLRFDRNNGGDHLLILTRLGVTNESTGVYVGSAWTTWSWSLAAKALTLYKDGTSAYSGAVHNMDTYSATSTLGYSTSFFQGEMAEILVYDSTLGTTDRQAVEAYLKAKWGTP